ncbi:alpha-1,3-mannosyl-glycoprotein 4-beta-N-acetylglucosaminyltransferase A-like [Danaus plexippus]|uniref:alpha-1,3-mannosyl-glycoprotein 4-beta-N-acetylglucosaminyltransferase A-like n=1 Tax=Danaus plexippus TaxID=13037 RepID=UPI002AB07A11|nr:alpha-1,3-mannosyl-glycoprotein 4-beta-N-acetylglucosaminyltransferase A-like [Danaus plexippus]
MMRAPRPVAYLPRRRGFCTLFIVIFVLSSIFISCIVHYYKHLTGTKWDLGANPKHAKPVMNSFAYQLMPHLNDHPSSLKPAFLLNGTRENCDVVIGIPTVHRDKGSYIISTVSNVIHGMTDEEKDKNLIVVLVAETQMDYVRPLVEKLATLFSEYIYTGLVELVVPSPFYYPDFDNLPLNFGDSNKRVMWRTKHNLNVLYVMAYARSRGTYYLMLEDDVTVKERFIEHMLDFAKAKTKSNPDWYVLEFCNIGGIGKLFKTSDLIYFMTYIQLFYKQMPIDWLLESYIADSSCSLDRATESCTNSKTQI